MYFAPQRGCRAVGTALSDVRGPEQVTRLSSVAGSDIGVMDASSVYACHRR
jgi:hypothetical protein